MNNDRLGDAIGVVRLIRHSVVGVYEIEDVAVEIDVPGNSVEKVDVFENFVVVVGVVLGAGLKHIEGIGWWWVVLVAWS